MNKAIFNVDSGDWLSIDKLNGTGRGETNFSVPAWNGREDRFTIRVIYKEKSMKPISVRQRGSKINELSVDQVAFPIEGGDVQILLKTNASSINALVTSDDDIKSKIKSFTTASGLNIDVNDKKLNYGFPGDPGLKDKFDVSLILSMPDNKEGKEVKENISINGILIPISQPGKIIPYISFERDFDEASGLDTKYNIVISSNIDEYDIEIIECEQTPIVDKITLSKSVVNIKNDGSPETVEVKTAPKNLKWRIG